MKGKLLGIFTITAFSICLLLAILIQLEGEFFKASNLQLLLVMFVASIVFAGLYLTKNSLKPGLTRIGLPVLGLVLILISVLVSFDIIPFLSSYNWLIALGLTYFLLIELQLLNWSNKPGLIPQICSFALILTHSFLIIFFITKWQYAGLKIFIDIAIYTSVLSLIVGLIAKKKVVDVIDP